MSRGMYNNVLVMKKSNEEIEILRLWGLIQNIYIKHYDVLNDRIRIRLDKKHIPQLYLEKKRSRVKTDDFAIHLKKDNRLLSTKNMGADDVLLSFIKIVGIDKIQQLGLKATGNEKLISDENDNRRKLLDGKYVFVKTSTPEKVNTIRKIIQRLLIEGEIIDE